jgi:pyruvate dehydrogenase E1 component alpha subunit
MITNLTKEDLIAFEEDIAQCFNNKLIRAPIHLYDGNEDEIINIFKENNIGQDDWIFCTWRSHYQHLLKGVPKERLKADILDGKSISLCYPEYKTFSSAIVTGSLPISVGVAQSIKSDNKKGKVYCFVGDMGSETGMMNECVKYSVNHKLPIKFIIEDNNKSVCTDTRKTWGIEKITFENANFEDYFHYYKYTSKWKHAGTNVRVQF